MDSSDRGKALLELFRQGLANYGQRQTQAMLGDRTAYIGMSDIARYTECPRAAVLVNFCRQEHRWAACSH
mgnify:CR=1 FL=1